MTIFSNQLKLSKPQTMKTKFLLLLSICIVFLFASCKKDSTTSNTNNTNNTTTGTIMFWSNQYGSNINVTVDGTKTGSITTYQASNTLSDPPACNTSGTYDVTLTTGSHTYTATDGSHNWSGSVTVGTGCSGYLLYW